eukprot:TRINITY_DN4083_c0_g2_i3.p1 TRINITY_DN4083_c0_g2~~TRINITY_DN4083_c0_g2_i3.p1  ORF type:complete len:385 (-),score=116.27 TRINITY_DN4083_c0_g2_i3:112-1266(-)
MVAQSKRSGVTTLLVGAVGAALVAKHCTFVPGPKVSTSRLPAAAAVGAAASLGAAPAFADEIGDAAAKLSDAAYPFMKEVDWNSYLWLQKPGGTASAIDWLKAVDKAIVMGAAMDSKLLQDAAMAHHNAIGTIDSNGVMSKATFTDINAAIGRLIASVPESKTLDVYNSFKALVGSDVPAYLMSKVNAPDAKAAYDAFWEFKDVVKAHPITPTEPVMNPALSSEKLGAVEAAAKGLSSASYPFIKDVDWTSDLYLKPLPLVSAKQALKAVDKMIVMGASMDGKLLKEAAEAHHKAIESADAKGITTLADYEAVNAAIGKIIASVPKSQVMEVYNTFAELLRPTGGMVPSNLFNTMTKEGAMGGDAVAAYQALMQFKDTVKFAQV